MLCRELDPLSKHGRRDTDLDGFGIGQQGQQPFHQVALGWGPAHIYGLQACQQLQQYHTKGPHI